MPRSGELNPTTLDKGSWGVLPMKLEAGRFYVSKDGHIWCCFRINPKLDEHWQAYCVRVADERVEYFYIDGRYDSEGKREHTLIDLLQVGDESTPEGNTRAYITLKKG